MRGAAALQVLGLPEEARAHHRALASWFAHARGFFKAEWRRRGDAAAARADIVAATALNPRIDAEIVEIFGPGLLP